MRYQEYPPPRELAPWIRLYWVYECRASDPVAETIVADGFPELIIHFRSPFSEADRNGRLITQPVAVACGQLTRPLVLHRSIDAGMIGIRFQPGGLAPFLSAPMRLLTDARVAADELIADVDQLVEKIVVAGNDVQRVAACNRFLLKSIDIDRENVGIRRVLERITMARGDISVATLATLMGTSRRSLELAFQKTVGTTPKMYCRITRFRHLYDAVSNGMPVNWVQMALDAGFFDQSHLIRDFRRFTGDTPTTFLADQTSFADSVNQVQVPSCHAPTADPTCAPGVSPTHRDTVG